MVLNKISTFFFACNQRWYELVLLMSVPYDSQQAMSGQCTCSQGQRYEGARFRHSELRVSNKGRGLVAISVCYLIEPGAKGSRGGATSQRRRLLDLLVPGSADQNGIDPTEK